MEEQTSYCQSKICKFNTKLGSKMFLATNLSTGTFNLFNFIGKFWSELLIDNRSKIQHLLER